MDFITALIPILMIVIWWDTITSNICSAIKYVRKGIKSAYENTIGWINHKIFSIKWIRNTYESHQKKKTFKPFKKEYTPEQWKRVSTLFENAYKTYYVDEYNDATLTPHTHHISPLPVNGALDVIHRLAQKLLYVDENIFAINFATVPVGMYTFFDEDFTYEHRSEKLSQLNYESIFKNGDRSDGNLAEAMEQVREEVREAIANETVENILFQITNDMHTLNHDNVTINYDNLINRAQPSVDSTRADIVDQLRKQVIDHSSMDLNTILISCPEVIMLLANEKYGDFTPTTNAEPHKLSVTKKLGRLRLTDKKYLDVFSFVSNYGENAFLYHRRSGPPLNSKRKLHDKAPVFISFYDLVMTPILENNTFEAQVLIKTRKYTHVISDNVVEIEFQEQMPKNTTTQGEVQENES